MSEITKSEAQFIARQRDKANETICRLYDALARINTYLPPNKLRRIAEKRYGLSEEEAIEGAYENVLNEARAALIGVRRPAPATPGGAKP